MSRAANKIVLVSDVHMGTNQPVSWYQPAVHDQMLTALLDYVSGTLGDQVQDLVFAGDLVDQWVVDPADVPPSFAEIVAAHEHVFGSSSADGKLQEVLGAISGDVIYLNGNHDSFITAADLATLRGAGGKQVKYLPGGVYLRTSWGAPILAKHGHQYSVFNAVDRLDDPPGDGRHGGLPLGHYITRLACRWVTRWLAEPGHEGRTAADLPTPGTPFGFQSGLTEATAALLEILYGIHTGKQLHLARIILDALSVDAGMSPDEDTIVPLPGYQQLTPRAAAEVYADLLTHWQKAYGDKFTAAALVESDIRSDLAWTMPTLGHVARVVVMGHTHEWVESEPHHCVYANCGFGCPTKPQLKDHGTWPSFVELTYDEQKCEHLVEVKQIKQDGSIVLTKARVISAA